MNCNFIFSLIIFLWLSAPIKGRPVNEANWDDSDSEEIGPNKENGDDSDVAEGTKTPGEGEDSDNGNNNDGENGDSPPTTTNIILVDDTKNEDNDDDGVSESQEKVVGDEVLRVPFPLLANSRIHELTPLNPGLLKIINSQPRQVPALPYERWGGSFK